MKKRERTIAQKIVNCLAWHDLAQNELAEEEEIDPADVSRLVLMLERKGIVRRQQQQRGLRGAPRKICSLIRDASAAKAIVAEGLSAPVPSPWGWQVAPLAAADFEVRYGRALVARYSTFKWGKVTKKAVQERLQEVRRKRDHEKDRLKANGLGQAEITHTDWDRDVVSASGEEWAMHGVEVVEAYNRFQLQRIAAVKSGMPVFGIETRRLIENALKDHYKVWPVLLLEAERLPKIVYEHNHGWSRYLETITGVYLPLKRDFGEEKANHFLDLVFQQAGLDAAFVCRHIPEILLSDSWHQKLVEIQYFVLTGKHPFRSEEDLAESTGTPPGASS